MQYKEIFRLKDMLEEAEIPFYMQKNFDGYQIKYSKKAPYLACSVIEHKYSYGGNDDRLEIQGLLTDKEREEDRVLGWLTAENVFNRIKQHYDSKEVM